MSDGTLVHQFPPARRPRTVGDMVRFVLRGIGQTLITCGFVVVLFVVYEVYVTNIFSHQAQEKVHQQLEKSWAEGRNPLLALPGSKTVSIPLGTGIANLYIPRLGRDYAFTIVEGTDQAALAKGPGHYLGTALPGQVGDFAVAGHRVGKGEPFLNLDKLRAGDPVIVETDQDWFVYRIMGNVQTGDLAATGKDGIPGREVVDPNDGEVILPVPDHPGAVPTERIMTMTTCTPKFSASQRLILHALLDPAQTVRHTGETKPPAIEALYAEVS